MTTSMIAAAITTPVNELLIPAPELRGAALALGRMADLEICMEGAAGGGKTFSVLYKIHCLLLLYPGAKALVVRKTQVALAGSAMATFREAVLDPREGVRYFSGNRIKPASFIYTNSSTLAMSGLDKPEKIKSYEYDIIYCCEATECTVDDIEFLRSRLRNGKLPYQQLLMCCNPDAPGHWLNQRMIAGTTTRLLSRHEDNPRYFDSRTHDWTEEGRKYIFEVLGGLTGVRLSRLRFGIWAAASGTVFEDSWDRARIVVDPFDIPKAWPRYWSADWGYTNPLVVLFAAVDPDGRLIIYRQIYHTKTLVEDVAKQIKRLCHWGEKDAEPFPREIICDHDAGDRAVLERHLGLVTTAAKKSVSPGLQAVAARFRPAGDGKPRIMIFRNSLVAVDPELAKAKRPTCLQDEPDGYVWDTKQGAQPGEQPVKADDHGCDALRYAVSHFDLQGTNVSYLPSLYR